MHLADSSEAFGDVSFSNTLTSAGLSSLSILIYTSLFVSYLEFNWCLIPLAVSRSSVRFPTIVLKTGFLLASDNNYNPHGNALILASKIPGAWLVQIKNAGHAVMNQYPAEIGKIVNTFLSTTTPNK